MGAVAMSVVSALAARAAVNDDPLRRAYLLACLEELQAPKPGNVSVYSAGHGMSAADFARSAEASAAPLCRREEALGARVLGAIQATWATARCNTNLGIVLLSAPLLMAAQRAGLPAPADAAAADTQRATAGGAAGDAVAAAIPPKATATGGGHAGAGVGVRAVTVRRKRLQSALSEVLRAADVTDTQHVFDAIRLASPAGLGETAEHDVRHPATIALREVMAAAADRDRVARQYAYDYADVFRLGLPALALAADHYPSRKWQVVALYLALLAWVPDTHVWRKFGADMAFCVRQQARRVREVLLRRGASAATLAALRDFDARLKSGGINPGTTADLTVATLLARRLSGG